MSLRNVYIVGGNAAIRSMFNHNKQYVCVDDIKDAAAVVFTGGADICPFLYGERPILNERGNGSPVSFTPERDMSELLTYRQVEWSIPKIGICRGAQLLNVLAGGSLWQDVDNHTTGHKIRVVNSNTTMSIVDVSSTHHQMMIPSSEATVIAYGTGSTKKRRQGHVLNLSAEAWEDPEILYNWTNNSLCFQPHPEYGPVECTRLFFDLIEETFFTTKKA